MKIQIQFVASLLLMFIAVSVSAGKFYKWVDESGNTHYSQNPPAHQQTDVVKTYNDKGYKAKPSERKEEKLAENGAQDAVPLIKKDKTLCAKAQKNIETLTSQPVIMQNGKLLTIEEKNKQVKTAKDIADIHC